MSDGFSQYQTSRLGVSAAKARAISERSQGLFDLGLTAEQEAEALERAEDQMQQIAKEAERNARKRGRKAGLGRLIGQTLGYVLGGPAGKAALGTALGGLAGTAAAGGFKSYGVDVPDSLVPGGIFYGRERDAFKQRAEDLEEAFDDLTDAQRQGIGKNLITDYLTGRGLGKLGEVNIKGTNASLDDLLEAGEISKVDYLKDIFRSAAGGIGEDRLSVLESLATKLSTDTASLAYGAYGKSVGPLNSLTNLDLDASRGLFNMNVVKPEVENLELFKKTKDLDSVFGLDVSPNNLRKKLTDEELSELSMIQSNANAFNRFGNFFKPGVPFQQTSIINPGVVGQEFTRDNTIAFKQLLAGGVITQEDYDKFMSNPYEFSQSFLQGSNIGSRKTNSLFQSTVGPMGAY